MARSCECGLFSTYDEVMDYRWLKHPGPIPGAEASFWDKTGWVPADLHGKVVLDFGCGNGSHALVTARYADRVIAVDPGAHAVSAARRNVEAAGVSAQVDIRHLDLYRLDGVGDESVDLAYALGSLHTTPNPRRAFAEVARTVRQGGTLAVWLQGNPTTHDDLLKVLNFLHDLTREVPIERLYEIVSQHAPVVRDLYRGTWGPLPQIMRVSNDTNDDECISATYAWHGAKYRSWHNVDEVAGWFRSDGYEVKRSGSFPVTIMGVRTRQEGWASRRAMAEKRQQERDTRRAVTGKPRVLLVSDVRGWAFDQNFHDLEEYLKDRFDFEHGYVWEWTVDCTAPFPDFEDYDVVFVPYHRWNIEDRLPLGRTLGALRAQWIFPEEKRPPGREEFELVNQYAAYQVVTRKNQVELSPCCPNVVYLTNAVNTRRFSVRQEPLNRLVASWSGNAGHSNTLDSDVKGFNSIVVPACERAGVELVYAEYAHNRLAPSKMPEFYLQGNVTLCASLYEGASSSVMEGMAAGHAAIVTDVGNHREMHESMLARCGDSGIVLVERTVKAFERALNDLAQDPERLTEMGRINREEMQLNWSWDVWADRFADFLMMPLKRQISEAGR